MAVNRPLCCAICSVFLILFSPVRSYTQQSSFQISLMSPAASGGALTAIGISADIVETRNESYLRAIERLAVEKDHKPFQPSPSDLLIEQAEERFKAGRKYYRVKDSDHARTEFDAAVDLMIQASVSPTNRTLYENKLDELVDSIHHLDLAGLGAEAPMEEGQVQFDKAPLEDILEMTFPVDPRLKTKVTEEVHATASGLPLVMNDAVVSYINYFSGRGRPTIVAGFQRAGRYKSMIQKVLAEEGAPQELIYLAQAESGFLPRAVSYAAAGGMWQFIQSRGNQYGLGQTAYSDDRYDPEKATRAAARHLKDLYAEFGDWYLAIAAYNCGPGGVERAIERTGYADFWELRARGALPAETTNYVPIILAMTIMGKNAKEYGLDDIPAESPVEYDTVEMAAPTSLALVGDLTDAPISYLTELNPALLRSVAPAGYSLHVPKAASTPLIAGLDSIPPDRRLAWRMHRVETGETLAAIARRYGATTSSIVSANHMASAEEPAPGDHLIIPAAYKEPPAPKSIIRRSSGRSRPRSVAGRTTASVGKPVVKVPAAAVRGTASVAKTAIARPIQKTAATVAQVRKPQPRS
jgi:membrane-bound lytic murein transglycosylase D